MIKERKKWMTYTYFNHSPKRDFKTTHLFSLTQKSIAGMVRKPFPTMVINLKNPEFVESWSDSTRTKIKRAQNENLLIERSNLLLPDILELFNSSVQLKGLHGYEVSDFKTLPNIQCTSVYADGIMLAGHVWLIDAEEKRAMLYVNASSHHSLKDDKALAGRAHYFLLWQDGLYLQKTGIEIMDLMGYEAETQDLDLRGVFQWKAGTHGRQEMLWHYYPSWFYLLRKLRNMVTR